MPIRFRFQNIEQIKQYIKQQLLVSAQIDYGRQETIKEKRYYEGKIRAYQDIIVMLENTTIDPDKEPLLRL